MGVPTYQPIANITLSSAVASVTFSAITQQYRDLVLVFDGSMTVGNTNLGLRFNGDSGSNYPSVLMYGDGSGPTSASGTYTFCSFAYVTTTDRVTGIVNIMDATATDKNKTILNRYGQPAGAGNPLVVAVANRWASNAAITSITVIAATNAIASGSTITMYGVLA